jgi:pyruvate dehydrogenase E1 component alpha subunit
MMPRAHDPAGDALVAMYRAMVLIRTFEEAVRRLAAGGAVPGLVHLSAGQEAVAVGVCHALAPGDLIASNHRGHGHCLAKGADPDRLMAEILGRAGGYGGGRSGSMHVFDPANGNLGTNGIVGGGVPLAAGAALSARVRGAAEVAVAFFGDGALNQGVVAETMNMAAVWSLPVVFVCEHNGFGEFTAAADVTAGRRILARGEALEIAAQEVDGMDVLAVHAAARDAVARARGGTGPSFLVCRTWRYGGHHAGDGQAYKDAAEDAAWRARDPIARLAARLGDAPALGRVRADVAAVVDAAVARAKAAPEPPPAALEDRLYA